jgi:hypothetical protein
MRSQRQWSFCYAQQSANPSFQNRQYHIFKLIAELDRKKNEYIREKMDPQDMILDDIVTYLVWSCRENGPNVTTKNYDLLETWRKETTRPSPENLERWNIYSHEYKRSKNGRMEQSKKMEYKSRKASSDVLKPRNIYIYIYIYIYVCVCVCFQIFWYGGPPYRVLNSMNTLLSPSLQNPSKVFSSADPIAKSLILRVLLLSS